MAHSPPDRDDNVIKYTMHLDDYKKDEKGSLHGRHAVGARLLNAASAGTSVFMNVIAAAPGWRDVAVWVMPSAGSPTAAKIGGKRQRSGRKHPAAPLRVSQWKFFSVVVSVL